MKSSGLLLAKMIDAELLAVVKSFRHLRHYLEQPCHTVDVVTDYSNLRAFMTTRKLTRRQCNWPSTCLYLIFGWFITRRPLTLRTVLHVDWTTREVPSQEYLTTYNTSALQKMLFLSVAAVIAQPLTNTKELARQILVIIFLPRRFDFHQNALVILHSLETF